MTLQESKDSSGEVSLEALFAEREMPASKTEAQLEDIAFLVCRGGWPRSVGQPREIALQQAYDYVDTVAEEDLSRVDGVRRDPHLGKVLMRSYARMVSSQGKLSEVRADIIGSGSTVSEKTLLEYVAVLRLMFVIEDMAAWNPNLISKTAIRTSDTRQFVDPSIASAALGLGLDDLTADLATFGLLFESMCIRDLRVYAQALDGEMFHYRDKLNLECDAVVHLRNGSYGLVEIKLGGNKLVEEGAKSLSTLKRKLDTVKMKPPVFLMVLTAVGPYSYARPDGVLVAPLTTLGC